MNTKNPEYFTPNHKVSDVIPQHPQLLLMLEHLGVHLPLQEKTFGDIAREYGFSDELLLSLTRLFAQQQGPSSITSFGDLEPIVFFLKNTHTYYLQEAYPAIHELITRLGRQNSPAEMVLVEQFFRDYFNEVRDHLRYEDETVFPYVLALSSGDTAQNRYSVGEYQEHHDDIEEKLEDLKNLLIKYLPCQNDQPTRRTLLLKLFELEFDLHIHSLIEELILIPLVSRLEASITSRP